MFMKLSCKIFPSIWRPLPSYFVIFMSQRIAFVFLFFLTSSIVDRTFFNGTHFFAFKIFHIVFFGEEMKAKTMKNICKADKNVQYMRWQISIRKYSVLFEFGIILDSSDNKVVPFLISFVMCTTSCEAFSVQ